MSKSGTVCKDMSILLDVVHTISNIKNQVNCMIWEHGSRSGTIFGFSVCAVPLQVTLVVYFRLELGTLGGGQLPEDSKACYCQY